MNTEYNTFDFSIEYWGIETRLKKEQFLNAKSKEEKKSLASSSCFINKSVFVVILLQKEKMQQKEKEGTEIKIKPFQVV